MEHVYDNKVSIAKAIAIILMVVGHSGCPSLLHDYIYMFHVPFFFFIGGFCFKDKYLAAPMDFIRHRLKGLYFPYVKYSLIFLLFHNVFYQLNIYNGIYGFKGNMSELYGLMDYMKHLVRIVFAMEGHDQLLGAFWFLKDMLFGSIVGILMLLSFKNKVWRAILALLAITIALKISKVCLPWFYITWRHFYAGVFFSSGCCLEKKWA